MVGSAIVRSLRGAGFSELVLKTREDLDLTIQSQVDEFFRAEQPEFVFLAAARVGGIQANNTRRAEFIYENLAIQTNVIHSAWKHGARKLLVLGSSCIYPKHAPQPMREDCLLTGPLESTNEPYAIAKIAGLKMAEAYRSQYGFNAISLMPTNLYGPNDNYDLETSHVLPALLRKFHEAKVENRQSVTVWGSGQVRREFLHVDDLADAALHLMRCYDEPEIVNVGVGEDVSICELAELVADVVEFRGSLIYDRSKPDGTPRKLLDVSRLRALGWQATIPLREGITAVYRDAFSAAPHG